MVKKYLLAAASMGFIGLALLAGTYSPAFPSDLDRQLAYCDRLGDPSQIVDCQDQAFTDDAARHRQGPITTGCEQLPKEQQLACLEEKSRPFNYNYLDPLGDLPWHQQPLPEPDQLTPNT